MAESDENPFNNDDVEYVTKVDFDAYKLQVTAAIQFLQNQITAQGSLITELRTDLDNAVEEIGTINADLLNIHNTLDPIAAAWPDIYDVAEQYNGRFKSFVHEFTLAQLTSANVNDRTIRIGGYTIGSAMIPSHLVIQYYNPSAPGIENEFTSLSDATVWFYNAKISATGVSVIQNIGIGDTFWKIHDGGMSRQTTVIQCVNDYNLGFIIGTPDDTTDIYFKINDQMSYTGSPGANWFFRMSFFYELVGQVVPISSK